MKHLKVSGAEVKPEHSCMMRNLAQCLKSLLWLDLILKKLIHRVNTLMKNLEKECLLLLFEICYSISPELHKHKTFVLRNHLLHLRQLSLHHIQNIHFP